MTNVVKGRYRNIRNVFQRMRQEIPFFSSYIFTKRYIDLWAPYRAICHERYRRYRNPVKVDCPLTTNKGTKKKRRRWSFRMKALREKERLEMVMWNIGMAMCSFCLHVSLGKRIAPARSHATRPQVTPHPRRWSCGARKFQVLSGKYHERITFRWDLYACLTNKRFIDDAIGLANVGAMTW